MRNWDVAIENNITCIKDDEHKKILKKYKRWMEEKEYSKATISEKIRINMKMLNYIGKDISTITIDDMEDYIYSDDFTTKLLKDGTRKPVGKSSLDTYKAGIRFFIKWADADSGRNKKKMKTGVFPDCVEWFEFSRKNSQKVPQDLFTEEEILAMLEKADNTFDRTLISLLYDSMGRLTEILTLRENDVHPDKYGFYIIIRDSKTFERRVRLHFSVPYIRLHLQNIEKGKYLFPSPHNPDKIISDTHIRRKIQKWADAAGIEKRVYPHLFRHSMATKIAGKLSEQTLKKIGGWKPSSRMTGVYVTLSGADTDRAQLEMYGLIPEDEEKEISPLEPKKCPRCHNLNPASNSAYCVVCGFSMNGEIPYETEMDIVMKRLEKLEKRNAMMKSAQEFENKYGEFASDVVADMMLHADALDDNSDATADEITIKVNNDNFRKMDIQNYPNEEIIKILNKYGDTMDEDVRTKFKKHLIK